MILKECITKRDGIWLMIYNEVSVPGEEVNIIPKNDLVNHKIYECECNPKKEQNKRKNGDFYYILLHSPYDKKSGIKL